MRLAALIFGSAALAGFATGCNRGLAQAKPAPPTVTVAPVEQREIVEWSEFTGRTEPVEMVEVRPRVSGHIQEVRFESPLGRRRPRWSPNSMSSPPPVPGSV